MVFPSGASVDESGLVTIHNRTELRAPRALFSAAPDASRPVERLPPGAFGYYRENDKHHYRHLLLIDCVRLRWSVLVLG
ncbi:hypothetical protein DIPPA_35009 [Diplonema papillatum]|nr:hypothetical protein DIPPA_35009 [Diplonema papillatum]